MAVSPLFPHKITVCMFFFALYLIGRQRKRIYFLKTDVSILRCFVQKDLHITDANLHKATSLVEAVLHPTKKTLTPDLKNREMALQFSKDKTPRESFTQYAMALAYSTEYVQNDSVTYSTYVCVKTLST